MKQADQLQFSLFEEGHIEQCISDSYQNLLLLILIKLKNWINFISILMTNQLKQKNSCIILNAYLISINKNKYFAKNLEF